MARSSQRGGGSQIISPNAVRRGNPVQFFQETVSRAAALRLAHPGRDHPPFRLRDHLCDRRIHRAGGS